MALFQVDSICKAVELPLSPDDEILIQNSRPAKRSTFELEQPAISAPSKRPAIEPKS